MSNYIPNMNFLSYIVVEISLTKNVERKKTNKHSKEVLNPKVKIVFVNLYGKYNGYGDIFYELRKGRRSDGRLK